MIKRIFLFCVLALALNSCDDSSSPIDISAIKTETRIQRFDSAFFHLDTADFSTGLQDLKVKYPPFFMSNETERFWRFQRIDGRQNELFGEVENNLAPFDIWNSKLNLSMKRLYASFPDQSEIKVFTYISNLDFSLPVFFNDSINSCFIGLDLFLGQNQPYYEFMPQYLAYYRQPAFMIRDCLESILQSKLEYPQVNAQLLEDMIYYGKVLFALQALLPDEKPHQIIKYNPEKYDFCLQNERQIWSYFVENQMLFSTKAGDKKRFVETAPFSKFGMKFDNQSPGRIGQWIGWQIVKKYMENHKEKSIPELFAEKDSRKILKLSSYRPS